jgi:hypothetical protein
VEHNRLVVLPKGKVAVAEIAVRLALESTQALPTRKRQAPLVVLDRLAEVAK